MRYALVLLLFLSGCASTYDQQYAQQEALYRYNLDQVEKISSALVKDLEEGRLSEAGFSQKRLDLERQYFPEAYNTIAALQDRLTLSKAMERGEITRLQFDLAWTERKRKLQEQIAAADAQQQQYMAQQQNQGMNPAAAMIMMNMINNGANRIVNSVQPQYHQPPMPINCNSYAFGNGVQTTCY